MFWGSVLRVLLVLLFVPQIAVADVFDRMTGSFGVPDVPAESCSANPVFSSFSPDRGRVNFVWGRAVPSYTGAMITAYGGMVVRVEGGSLIMLRDNETRLTDAGQPVLWEMRPTVAPDGYCWHRLDWDPAECLPLIRCTPEANS